MIVSILLLNRLLVPVLELREPLQEEKRKSRCTSEGASGSWESESRATVPGVKIVSRPDASDRMRHRLFPRRSRQK